jgi:hypothetical protein
VTCVERAARSARHCQPARSTQPPLPLPRARRREAVGLRKPLGGVPTRVAVGDARAADFPGDCLGPAGQNAGRGRGHAAATEHHPSCLPSARRLGLAGRGVGDGFWLGRATVKGLTMRRRGIPDEQAIHPLDGVTEPRAARASSSTKFLTAETRATIHIWESTPLPSFPGGEPRSHAGRDGSWNAAASDRGSPPARLGGQSPRDSATERRHFSVCNHSMTSAFLCG